MQTSGSPMEQVKQAMRAAWMAGDFGVVARTIAGSGEKFIERLALPAESRVLDVACGTGNTAIPLARQGFRVTGVDIASNLLLQARERAAEEHLEVQFDEGDAEQLPYPDGSFDAVISMFGAMFAPRPELVVREFARVLRPEGRLGMANWNPESFTGEMFRVSARHVAPPPGIPAPVLWGDDRIVRERLGAEFHQVETEIVPVRFDLPMNPAGAVNFFRQYFGPTKMAFSRLDGAGQADMSTDLEALWAARNTAEDPTTHTIVQNEYLYVSAIRN